MKIQSKVWINFQETILDDLKADVSRFYIEKRRANQLVVKYNIPRMNVQTISRYQIDDSHFKFQ